MVEENTVENAVDLVTKTIIIAAESSIRKSSGRISKQTRPWWNSDCQETYRNKRKSFNYFRRHPTVENFRNYKKCKAIFRRTLRRSQKESWENYVSKITTSITSKQLWQKVKRCSGLYPNNQINILQYNNQTISSVKDIANTIAGHFSNISSNNSYPTPFKKYKTIEEKKLINFQTEENFSYNNNFNLYELKTALNKTHKTSCGPDGVSYSMLKNLSHDSLNNLLYLYNRIWTEHTFPASWRMATIIPILKPGKNATDPMSYRPIALTSCMGKVLEKMINSRLMYYIEKNNCLSKYQSGFRRGRSSIDNALDLESKIRNAFIRKNHLVAIFFDIEKAYDRTWRYGILRQLYNHDIRGNLAIFIQNFLYLRNFKVRVGNTMSDVFIQEEGVPQGSVLSVTLFILAIDKILGEIPTSVKGSLYVDDLHISCEGSDMRYINRQLQTAVNKISKWSERNGFKFSPSKTSCVHFCRKRGIHPDPDIHFSGQNIEVVSEAKFLGIIFDNKLTFRSHIAHLKKKCTRNLNILKVLSNTSWGANRTCLLKIYNAVIRSKLDYGCAVYGSSRKSVLLKLDTIHHTALRLCTGAFRTSPVQSLYVDSYQAPLSIIRDILSIQYYFRISSLPNHPMYGHKLNSYLTRLYQAKPSYIPPFSERMKQLLIDIGFEDVMILSADFSQTPWDIPRFTFLNPFHYFDKSSTAPIIYQQLFYNHRQRLSDYTPIFTDGSKSDNFVGCAFIIGDIVKSHRLHPSFSIFTAEIIAIVKALEDLSQFQGDKFIFYVDSLSVLEALSSPNQRSHPLIHKVLHILDRLSSLGFKILFCWVPSHVGISGNELADKRAKTAKDDLRYPLPYSDAKHFVKHRLYNKWQQRWNQETANKLYNLKPNIKDWPLQPSRKHNVVLTRLRIGHTRFTHRHLLMGEPAPVCLTCNVPMTVRHILIECPDFKLHRQYHFHSQNISMYDLLGPVPHPKLFCFLNHISFYHFI
jgi:ribonuclease HI